MSSIGIIKPLSTDLSSAVNKSRQHQEINFWERQESNPTSVSRVAPYWDLWRTLFQLSYSAAAGTNHTCGDKIIVYQFFGSRAGAVHDEVESGEIAADAADLPLLEADPGTLPEPRVEDRKRSCSLESVGHEAAAVPKVFRYFR